MSQLQCFENSMFGRIRVIERDGEPWFVAKDVCECLDLDTSTLRRLDDDERETLNKSDFALNAESGNGLFAVVSEPGLYSLILGSRKPEAREFKRWITHEVIPSIRKTGGYGIRSVEDMINNPDTAIQLLTQVKILRLQNEQLAIERDTAIKTKAWIGSRREATAMNTASQKSKECERLREQLGDAEHWKQVKAIRWLSQYFALSKGLYGAVAHKLKDICSENGWERRDIPDTEYGTVKAYPIDAIEILRQRIEADANMLGKYRLV